MAFKLIEEGITKQNKLWRGQCRSCNAIAECAGSDITHETFDQREGGSFSWEKCPYCGAGAVSGYGGLLMYPKK